jgi:outer membrane protein OmpU
MQKQKVSTILKAYTAGTTTKTARIKQDSDSIQVAYSMGAMSVKAYKTEINNPNYDQDAAELEANEIAIGLAF